MLCVQSACGSSDVGPAQAVVTLSFSVEPAQMLTLEPDDDGTIRVAALLTGQDARLSEGKLLVIGDPGEVGAHVLASSGHLSMEPDGEAVAMWIEEPSRNAVAGR